MRHLFIADTGTAEIQGLKKRLNQPEKHPLNPIIVAEHPWEAAGPQVYGSVIYDQAEGAFKMWYLAQGKKGTEHDVVVNGRSHGRSMQAYATSADGIRWEKPQLGLVDFDGSRDNNLLPLGLKNVEGLAVIKDDHDTDPRRRYKAFWYDFDGGLAVQRPDGLVVGSGPEDGMWTAWSADGVHWADRDCKMVIHCYSDTGHQLLWDSQRERYVAFGRLGTGRRVIARTESSDFIHWSPPELVSETDDADDFNAQLYGMGTFIYEGLYIGMPWYFRQRCRDSRAAQQDDRIWAQLACSRDGKKWLRVGDRAPFIPNGSADQWDSGIIYTATQPVVMEDQILIYYFGRRWPHRPAPDDVPPGAIGLATLRRDGFVSLDADDEEGYVVTMPWEVADGSVMHINADAARGRIMVQPCCAETFEPLADVKPSATVESDTTDAVIVWGGDQIKSLVGKTVRLRIYAHRAKLYSYWFARK